MEKEEILQQIKEKLLPSVRNFENKQETDYDYFPTLLWMLLEKSKDTESSLKDISSTYSEEIKKISNTAVEKNQENRKCYEELLSKAVNFIVGKNKELNKQIEGVKTLFYVSIAFQFIGLMLLAFILIKKL